MPETFCQMLLFLFQPSVPVRTSVMLTLKGDVTTIYNVILTGLVSFK